MVIKLSICISFLCLIYSACKDAEQLDPIGPTMEFIPGLNPLVSGNDTLPKESFFGVHMIGAKGSDELKDLRILEDGIILDTHRLNILKTQGDIPSANPLIIPSVDRNGFEYAVWITKPESGLFEFTYILRDVNDLEFSKKIYLYFFDVLPTLTYIASFPTEIPVGSWIFFDLDADRGTANFDMLAAYEDGVLITDLDRLHFNQFPIASNPLMLPITNVSQVFHMSIKINKSGLQVFKFSVRDEDGYSAEVSFSITAI